MRLVLATICITLLASEAAQAIDCGYAHKRPTGAHVGTAPLAIGDSVMLGAASALAHKGFEVDARCARNPAEGLQLVRQRSRRGTLPEIVVLALGTNIAISTRDIGRMLRTIGHRRTLMLVTPFRSWHPFHTQPMRRVAHRHPKRVKLIDWSARATGNRQWFWSDGTHLRPTGVEVYSRMLKRAAWSRLRGRFG
jgi:lysophospholipase L1-like esterase